MSRSFLGPGWLALALAVVAVVPVVADETDPNRPAAIRTASVPVVPSEIHERLARYEHTRSASFAGWSPDGAEKDDVVAGATVTEVRYRRDL